MRRLGFIIVGLLLLVSLSPQAQDGLNLPTELYVLLNQGVIERYGLGTSGVQQVTPEGDFVLDFRVAPDNTWIAYRTQDGLFLKNMFTEDTPRQIEDARAGVPPTRGRGETMAWSNASDALAYTTEYGGRVHFFREGVFADMTTPDLRNLVWSPNGTYLAAEAGGDVWWIYRRDGTVMNLAAAIPGAKGADWLSDNELVFAPLDGGLVLLDLANNNTQTPLLNASQRYFLPKVINDSEIVVFAGELTSARLQRVTLNAGSVIEEDAADGAVDLTSARWSPSEGLLIIFQGGALALVDPASGSGFTLPINTSATYSWGTSYPPSATGFTLPTNGLFLALDDTGVQQLWRLPQDATSPAPMTNAELDITDYAFAPDTVTVAYISNSGLWVYRVGSADDARELITLNSANPNPAWSIDGTRIYFRDERDDESGIYAVDVESGEVALFVADNDEFTYQNPVPATGISAILVNQNERLAVVDTNSGEVVPIGVDGVGKWISSTQILANGIVSRGTELGEGLIVADANDFSMNPQVLLPLIDDLRLDDYHAIDVNTVRAVVRRRVPAEYRVLDIPLDGSRPQQIRNVGYLVEPTVSPDGSVIMGYTAPDGALVLYDIASDTHTRLANFPNVSQFSWR